MGDNEELNLGTSPLLWDTDGDGFNDGDEVAAGANPLDAATYPCVADGDLNGDGLVNDADVLAQRGLAVCLTEFAYPEPASLYFTFCQDLQGLFGNWPFHGDMGVVIRDIDFPDLLARQIGIRSQGA